MVVEVSGHPLVSRPVEGANEVLIDNERCEMLAERGRAEAPGDMREWYGLSRWCE